MTYTRQSKTSVRILIKIADAIEISLEYLLGRSSENEYIPAVKPSTYHIRVQELAKEKNVTFGMMANSLVITFPRTYFYQWQKNKTYPSIDYLIQIATYFSVSLDYLTGRSDYKN